MPGSRDIVITPADASPAVILSSAFTILPTSPCFYTVAPLSSSFPASERSSGSVVVTSNVNTSQCNFHIFGQFPSNVDWIIPGPKSSVAIGAAGAPAEVLTYQVAPNTSAGARSTAVSIFGENVTLSQAGTGTCSYRLVPGSTIFPMNGGSAAINVSAAPGCSWSARSALAWVHVIAGSSGSGNGTVVIQADSDAGSFRSGFITIAGEPFAVSQSASACGATDVSSQVSVARGPILSEFIGGYYHETVTLRNNGTTNVSGPIYLVLDGLPLTSSSRCGSFLGQAQTCGVTLASLTYCQSPTGSDMVLFSHGLGPGQAIGGDLTFVPGIAGGAQPPGWYTTRVFSGTPNQ
jgi:hypothetical protein